MNNQDILAKFNFMQKAFPLSFVALCELRMITNGDISMKRNEFNILQEFDGFNNTKGLVCVCRCGRQNLVAVEIALDYKFSCCLAKFPRKPENPIKRPRKRQLGRQVNYEGRTQNISSWAREFNVDPKTIRSWVNQDGVICPPSKDKRLVLTYKGETKTLLEWSKLKAIPYRILHSRVYNLLWPLERALEEPLTKKKGITKQRKGYDKQYYTDNRERILKRKREERKARLEANQAIRPTNS